MAGMRQKEKQKIIMSLKMYETEHRNRTKLSLDVRNTQRAPRNILMLSNP